MRISARTLDGLYGRPATDVPARLEKASNGDWEFVASAITDDDGCISGWHEKLACGLYRIVFDSDRYFARLGLTAGYSEIIASFRLRDEAAAYQIQISLAPCSYSTYFESHH
ncbi:hydroxyisourate hydrolase [Spongiactinospora sp. TRM90649]|uniref:hydroxyisourate hydrolase n=1 Tax=Spongiactinospora sp. TRM90649 TaxID=3031114 RepID=UPI0023FA187F|nr:hydroxyisourate hydrolase [Spongiactinospora sp. TRM90649]MDF5759325.1 hydroxyisourate hydrolase [Spongiactinospora sp. TRM90649]